MCGASPIWRSVTGTRWSRGSWRRKRRSPRARRRWRIPPSPRIPLPCGSAGPRSKRPGPRWIGCMGVGPSWRRSSGKPDHAESGGASRNGTNAASARQAAGCCSLRLRLSVRGPFPAVRGGTTEGMLGRPEARCHARHGMLIWRHHAPPAAPTASPARGRGLPTAGCDPGPARPLPGPGPRHPASECPSGGCARPGSPRGVKANTSKLTKLATSVPSPIRLR